MLIYIGPGLGIGAIILVFVVLALILAALTIVLWVPIKRFWRRLIGKDQ